jgi:thiamine-phosphate pyrophosphorylase
VSALNNSQTAAKRPLLCYVTNRKSLSVDKNSASLDLLLSRINAIISAGVDWVQIREKDLSAKDLSRVVRETLRSPAKHAAGRSSRILVNDRLDVALSEGAGGLHLPENGLPIADAKQLVHGMEVEDFLVGVSCHSREAAEAAAASGADYIFFGPVFATPSKVEFGQPQGLERLAQICRAVQIPVIAIGGVTLENAASCITAGAAGIAAIRLFQDAGHLAATLSGLRSFISSR